LEAACDGPGLLKVVCLGPPGRDGGPTVQSKDQKDGGLLGNVVVVENLSLVERLARKDQSLLFGPPGPGSRGSASPQYRSLRFQSECFVRTARAQKQAWLFLFFFGFEDGEKFSAEKRMESAKEVFLD